MYKKSLTYPGSIRAPFNFSTAPIPRLLDIEKGKHPVSWVEALGLNFVSEKVTFSHFGFIP